MDKTRKIHPAIAFPDRSNAMLQKYTPTYKKEGFLHVHGRQHHYGNKSHQIGNLHKSSGTRNFREVR